MTVIQAKQAQPLWKSRTVLAGLIGILSILLTVFLVRSLPILEQDSDMIFGTFLSVFGAIIVKLMGTDLIAMLSEMMVVVFRDGKIGADDISTVIGELLLDTNGLTNAHVDVIQEKLVEKGIVSEEDKVEIPDAV